MLRELFIVFVSEEYVRKDYKSIKQETAKNRSQSILFVVVVIVPLGFMYLICSSTENMHWVLWIFLIWFCSREAFQLLASFRHYIFRPENYMEIGIAILAVYLISNSEPEGPISRNVAAFVIILSWFELMTMLVQHPRLARSSFKLNYNLHFKCVNIALIST